MMENGRRRSFGLGLIALIAALGLMFAFVVWGAVRVWAMTGDVTIPLNGWIAMGLGIGLTLIVGVGLMWLLFYSARKGYDERVGDPEE
jgi:hypothetical protein